MPKLLNLALAALVAWGAFVILCTWADPHCDGEHTTECAAEYGLWRKCSLGLDDK